MQMTKELEERLKLMQHFNQVMGDKRSYYTKKIYNDKIFIHKVGDYTFVFMSCDK